MSQKAKSIILVLLVLMGFLLRIWGTAGIYVRPDDHEQIGYAKTAYHQYFQHYLSYPVFYQYVGGYILKGINYVFHFLGTVEKGYKKEFNYDEIAIIMRILSALYGAVSIYLTYLVARNVFDEKTAVLSSFFLTFSFFHVLMGHTALLDPQMGFFALLAFFFITGILKNGRTYNYILAGLFTGFSIASKYNAVFIVFPLVLAHILAFKEIKRPWKIINLKIIVSGIFTVIGFLVGNPPVWLNFKSWFAYFKQIPIILKPDPWMVEFKNLSFIDWIRYNKFTSALNNINYSIKSVLFILLITGFIFLLLKLKKETILIFSFPLIYILLGLGIYDISRPRDHYVLIPFYLIISAKGFTEISDLIKKRIGSKILYKTLFFLLLIIVSYQSLKSSWEILYLFRERDTLEFSEDWVYENIPPKTWNTYELYTPFMYMPASVWKYGYIFPYRYHHNFYFILGRWLGEEPFEHLRKTSRFVYTSSTNSNRFKGVEKFYKKEVNFYNKINREFKILKEFSLKEIEAKNPDIFIFSVKKIPPKESSIIFPEQISLNQKVRDVFFSDWGDYGKTNLIKLLSPYERIERLVVSGDTIEKFVVFAYGKEGDCLEINGKNLRISKDSYSFLELEGKEILYPSDKNVYLIKINSISENPVLVKILFEPLKIGWEFFENNNWEMSIDYFLKKLKEDPENLDALILLNEAKIRKGDNLKEIIPEKAKKITSYTKFENIEKWMRWVEKVANIDVQYLLDSKTVFLEFEDIGKEGVIINDPVFLNRKGLLLNKSKEIELPFILPQDYLLFLTLRAPSELINSKIELTAGNKAYSPTKIEPLGNKFFRLEIPFNKSGIYERLVLRVTLHDPFLILDDMKIQPDLVKFLARKNDKLKEFRKFLGLRE